MTDDARPAKAVSADGDADRRRSERRSDVRRRIDRLEALVEASRLVYSSLDVDELLDNILAAATKLVGAARGTVFICDHESQEIWSRVTAGSERLEIRLAFGTGLAGTTAVSGETLRVDDVQSHPLFDADVDHRTGFTTENALCIPIRDRHARIAIVLQLLNKPGGFGDADIEFLDLMGVHVAQALHNAQAQQALIEQQKLVKELELAQEIQNQLLPAELPRLAGLRVAGRMITSRQVGGDYYDAIALLAARGESHTATRADLFRQLCVAGTPKYSRYSGIPAPCSDEKSLALDAEHFHHGLLGGRTLLVLADVSGKGVAAGLVMSNLQAALRATASLGLSLDRWAEQLNEMLYERLAGARYVTGFFLALEPGSRKGSFLSAGHPPALVLGPAGSRRLESTGMPLGMLPGGSYETGEVELEQGSSLLLYSDGLTEALDADGNELGVDGLEKIFMATALGDAEAAADEILSKVVAYGKADPNPDDRTLLLAVTV